MWNYEPKTFRSRQPVPGGSDVERISLVISAVERIADAKRASIA